MQKAVLVLVAIGLVAVGAGQTADPLDPLAQVYQLIRAYYYRADAVDDQELIYGAIRGMIDSLGDPYSVFLAPEEYARWQESLSGEYSGVGMELTVRDDRITVVTAFPRTPAATAGVRPGDLILSVDGESTEGMKLEEVSARIRGPDGTSVTLTIQHQDGAVEEIALVRQRIRIESVEGKYLAEERVGYVRLSRFDIDTAAALGGILYSFPWAEMRGLVLDLRNNPGGYLVAAVEVASFFVDEGTICVTAGPAFSHSYPSQGNGLPNFPLAVLVNEGTASAAEIVAGAIQDHGVGILVGQPTFGKGLIQEIVWQSRDGAAVKLTTGEYFIPSGQPVDGVGLTPDIFVEAEEKESLFSEEKESLFSADEDLEAALEWISAQAESPVH